MKMKQLLALITIILVLSSCGWSEKNHQVSKPYTRTNDVERIPVKFDTGYREVAGHYDASGKWIPKHYVKDTIRPVLFETVHVLYVDVTPSRESVFKSAEATGWKTQIYLGVGLFMFVIIVAIYITKKNGEGFGNGETKWLTRFVLIGVASSLALILLNPINKSGNNKKTIRYDRYQEIIKTDPNLIQFYDSIQKAGKFVN